MSVDSFHASGHSPGPGFDKPTAVFPTASRCRVGLLRRAHQNRALLSSGGPGRIVWTDRVDDVLTSDVDIVVEAIGDVEPAVEPTSGAGVAPSASSRMPSYDDLRSTLMAWVAAAAVPAPVPVAPRAIIGLEAANNSLVTTSGAEFAEHAERVSLCGLGGLCVDRRLEAEVV